MSPPTLVNIYICFLIKQLKVFSNRNKANIKFRWNNLKKIGWKLGILPRQLTEISLSAKITLKNKCLRIYFENNFHSKNCV